MSYDIFLQHFERGESAEADRVAVGTVLRELGAIGPDDLGHYNVVVSDLWEMVKGHSGPVTELEVLGGPKAVPSAEHRPYLLAVSATDLDSEEDFRGCAFFLHAFSPGVADVIFRIAEAGSMAIIPAAQIGPLLPPTADSGDLPEGMRQPQRIASGRELFSVLSADYGRYATWRDRVITAAATRLPLLHRLARGIRGLGRRGPGR